MIPPPRLRPHRFRQQRPRSGAGFTLVELLLGVTLGALLVGSLGGALLVSELRLSTSIRADIDRRDAINRAVALIRSEISSATRLSTVVFGNASNICVSTGSLQSLQLSTPGALQNICYRAVSRSSSIVTTSFPNTDNLWTGNCLLVRFGPPYDPTTGEIGQGSREAQVILDDLASNAAGNCLSTSFRYALTTASSASDTTLFGGSRDVDVTITQSNNQVTQFSARSGSNPLYSGNDLTSNLSTSASGCDANGSRHLRLDLANIPTLDRQCRNILYLANRYASYSPPPSCSTNGACTINGTTINNVDVLVFADRELRP